MTLSTFRSALILGLLAAVPLAAQEAPPADPPPAEGAAPEAPAVPDDLSMGEPLGADGIGSSYTEATFDAWLQRCVRTEDGADPCQLYQLLKDGEGNAVAEITMFGLPAGGEAAAGATAIVPLGTLLTEGLLLSVDQGEPKRYPFAWCSEIGCVARIGLTAAEVDAFRKGSAATMTIVPVMAPEEKVSLTISLAGFTKGLAAVDAANAGISPDPVVNPAEDAPAEAPAEGSGN
jgi:invasion protein IalB